MIEICGIGGYSEVGKNCTAIKIDDEVVILDMGLHMEKYIQHTEGDDFPDMSAKKLTEIGAVPDVSLIDDWKDKVIAILPSHAHLDHMGAVPFISNKFNADIITPPYAKAVLETILKDEKITLKNPIKPLNPNASHKISDNITVEFINMTHSTPQTVTIALHTKHGIIIYSNDFKFDNNPVLGKKPNYERLKELAEKGILCLILDSIYAYAEKKTPSESVAREMLRDVMLGVDAGNNAIIITTFASHIARLKSIIEFGKQLNRKIVFMGRSLHKYVKAAEKVNIVNFSKDVDIIKFKDKIKKKLKQVQQNRGKYLLVITGHQAEPKAVLSRILNGEYKFQFQPADHIIFSCTVIPTATNKENREHMEKLLKEKGVRIFKDVHVSGHGAREDQRDIINMLKPKHLIAAHVDHALAQPMIRLGEEMGYKKGETVHELANGKRLKLS